MAEYNRYGTGQETGPNEPGHNPSVGSHKQSNKGGMDKSETPSGYKRGGYTRSGRHNCVED